MDELLQSVLRSARCRYARASPVLHPARPTAPQQLCRQRAGTAETLHALSGGPHLQGSLDEVVEELSEIIEHCEPQDRLSLLLKHGALKAVHDRGEIHASAHTYVSSSRMSTLTSRLWSTLPCRLHVPTG